MDLHPEAADIVKRLELTAHVEGGYYRRVYTGKHTMIDGKAKSLSTTIYYLLNGSDVSKFHRLTSDEIWFYHTGSPFEIHGFLSDGSYARWLLGADLAHGELPQVTIPAGTIFGSHLMDEHSFGFVSCMVSPGFDFQDFELMSRESLLDQFPTHRSIIEKLT